MGRAIATADETEAGALYCGDVFHRRVRPKKHCLRYRMFAFLVDLDRLDVLDRGLRLFSVDRFNLFSFHRADYGPRDGSSIGRFVRERAARAGLAVPVARIRMLAYPRLLGYVFNPLTTYFLEDRHGRLVMIVYEVHNTFKEVHFYDCPVTQTAEGVADHEVEKAFFVSPFNGLDGTYRFSIRPPGRDVFLGIVYRTDAGPVLTASFYGGRRALTDRALVKVALEYPIATVKVVVGIHWEALLLWLKGVPPRLGVRRKQQAEKAGP